MTEAPIGFISVGDYAKAGAGTGAVLGGLLALLVGAGFLFVPGFGVVMIAGPIAAPLLAGVQGGVAGGMLGSFGRWRSLAGVFRKTGPCITRRTSKRAGFSSSSGPALRLSLAHATYSPARPRTTSTSTSLPPLDRREPPRTERTRARSRAGRAT